MEVAKPDNNDFDAVIDLLNACELALDIDKYCILSPEEKWNDLDEDDPDKEIILAIQKSEGVDVDDRILMFEFLKRKFRKASTSWRRVYWASTILVDNCCDPHEDVLAYHPAIDFKHVENEQ